MASRYSGMATDFSLDHPDRLRLRVMAARELISTHSPAILRTRWPRRVVITWIVLTAFVAGHHAAGYAAVGVDQVSAGAASIAGQAVVLIGAVAALAWFRRGDDRQAAAAALATVAWALFAATLPGLAAGWPWPLVALTVATTLLYDVGLTLIATAAVLLL
jgi:hypothetical protein